MQRIAWTERNEALLRSLTSKVRFLSTEQIARAWWAESPTGRRTAERQLERIQQAGFIERKTIIAHLELPLHSPLFCWQPQEPQPDFGGLTYLCERRWTKTLSSITVWVASRKAANHFGGFGGEIFKPNQVTHDLHVGAIYVRLFREAPLLLAEGWIPEEHLMHLGERVPDAILFTPDGEPVMAHDFGGFGDRERLDRLHRVCARWRLPYAIW